MYATYFVSEIFLQGIAIALLESDDILKFRNQKHGVVEMVSKFSIQFSQQGGTVVSLATRLARRSNA